MISWAKRAFERMKDRAAGNVSFEVGDIRRLAVPDGSQDKVVVIRVVINLGARDTQINALRESARVLRPGGCLLLSEATQQGWNKLNRFREEWGLHDVLFSSRYNEMCDQAQRVASARHDAAGVAAQHAALYEEVTRLAPEG